ncbi:BCCT family transporter [Natribacillus halophilus]|uniref:Glycine betaine transporter n=1 Tax=Natribacillus halophilus TaxID=549003 RepID=A0A1G8QH64_9BACI|nr:BCCT family transporter [Natribacillus halophilus]SDJ03978.1 glycine betaine transporter [Natribacillus halophilus]
MKKYSVLIFSVLAIVILVAVGFLLPQQLESFTGGLQLLISESFGWYYLLLVTLFLLTSIYFLFSPAGKLKLGKPDEEPEFGRISWITMLFGAGLGIGLVFFGAYEPLSHYAIQSPTGELGTPEAATNALTFSYFHWGLHGWGVYSILALALAFYHFRNDHPALISSTLRPILRNSVKGFVGKLIDIVAVIATVIGVATSLGFGATQLNGGFSYLFGLPTNFFTQVIIVLVITVLFMISAWSGLAKGIRWLSNTNMLIAGVLFILMLIIGPTIFNLNLFTDTLGNYIQTLPRMSFRIAPFDAEIRDWINDWTLFYWAWWIAWAPFVGSFIARVSRGRSVREFIFAVLLVPSIIVFLWFTIFGGSAISVEQSGVDLASLSEELVLFGMFLNVDFGVLLSILAMVMLVIFFITSADSATLVLGMYTANGSDTPPTRLKLLWGVLLSVTALVLLYSGGLQALENALIIAALPFSVVMLLMTLGLIVVMTKEGRRAQRKPFFGKLKRKTKH